jgi:hypothetical protein
LEEQKHETEESTCVWESNVIFIGYKNIDFESQKKELGDSIQQILQKIQCPDSTEHVWKSIHDSGLTTIFPISPSAAPNSTDFSLKNIRELLDAIQSWDRPNLRFVLVYDAELIRELLKLSGQKVRTPPSSLVAFAALLAQTAPIAIIKQEYRCLIIVFAAAV